MPYLSKCCAAPVEVQGGVTQWWMCTRCRNACDAVQDARETGYTGKHAKPALRCQHCRRDIFPTGRMTPDGDPEYADAERITVCMKAGISPFIKTEFVLHKPLPEVR